tara:strand:+ start:638 stop:754 length:117 start_codon:yes stop_codon:yes gene_type:complete
MNTIDGQTFDIIEWIETATTFELEFAIREMQKELEEEE